MYKYKAKIINIVDGDTVDAEVDVGFSITIKHRFRILNLDTPETWRPKSEAEREHGKRATIRATELLFNSKVTLISHKLGIYGRYIAEIILENGEDYAKKMINEGFQKLPSYEKNNN